MNKHLVAPSLLAADFGRLSEEITMVNNSKADWLHLDVMDGEFVPNISFGFPVIKTAFQLSKIPLDVHLMIIHPERYIKRLKELGAYMITVHYEACPHLHRTVQQIKEQGVKAGVAINPHTSVEALVDIIKDCDLILNMSVNPGFGGQKFIPQTLNKVRRLKNLIEKSASPALIQVDGGVKLENAKEILNAGVDVLVAGSTVFKSEDPARSIERLKNINSKSLSIS
jgi:ribulose-phosphate 3-epimerase